MRTQNPSVAEEYDRDRQATLMGLIGKEASTLSDRSESLLQKPMHVENADLECGRGLGRWYHIPGFGPPTVPSAIKESLSLSLPRQHY